MKPMPTILVCTSSEPSIEDFTKRYIQAVDRALSNQPYHVVVTMDRRFASCVGDRAICLFDFPSHDALLPMVDAVVTHAGLGTLQKVMRYGKPMVVVPSYVGQDDLARQCEALGVGVSLELHTPSTGTSERIAAAVARTLDDEDMKRKCESLKTKLESLDANKKCADAIEKFLCG